MAWQPIETAPKDGTRILLWLADEGFSLTASWRMPPIQMEDDELCWWSFEHDMDIGEIHDITHWMPLPEPPK